MSTDLKRRNIPFSPPDMTEAEANEVRDAILPQMDCIRPHIKVVYAAINRLCRGFKVPAKDEILPSLPYIPR